VEVLLNPFVQLVLTLASFGMAGLAAAWALLRGWKPRWVVLMGAFTMGLFVMCLFLLDQAGQKQDVLSSIRQYFDQKNFEENWKLYSEMMMKLGIFSNEKLDLFKDSYQKYFYWSVPAWLAVRCLIGGLVAYYLVSFVLSRITTRVPRPISFKEWVVPEPLIFGLIAAVALKLLAKDNIWVEILGDNLLFFFIGLYILGGFSIVSFFLNKWRFPRVLRYFSYFGLFFLVSESICALGVLDVWLDFRKIKTPPTEEQPT
jgi:uncharacterized protein YybS (DUF2232 family)